MVAAANVITEFQPTHKFYCWVRIGGGDLGCIVCVENNLPGNILVLVLKFPSVSFPKKLSRLSQPYDRENDPYDLEVTKRRALMATCCL